MTKIQDSIVQSFGSNQRPRCGVTGCGYESVWIIRFGEDDQSYTTSCVLHVAELLEEDVIHAVYPVSWEAEGSLKN